MKWLLVVALFLVGCTLGFFGGEKSALCPECLDCPPKGVILTVCSKPTPQQVCMVEIEYCKRHCVTTPYNRIIMGERGNDYILYGPWAETECLLRCVREMEKCEKGK